MSTYTDDTASGRLKASAVHGPRRTYPQNWPAYNAAQSHEKQHVAALLRSLCDAVESPPQHRGRPRIPLSDAIFSAVMKVYGTTSGRRAMTDMREYEALGLIDRAPSYNSIFNALENPDLTPLLKGLIEESARPLRSIERDFAVDSSGFSSSVYQRWFDAKYGKARSMTAYIKAHVMIGVTTNVVTSIEVTPSNGADYTMLAPLLKRTAAHFDMEQLSADKAYSGRSNLEAIQAIGAEAYIPFKSNTRALIAGLWKQAFEFYRDHEAEFLAQYHKRSNVETTFSMIKAKFGAFVRSKTPVAQVNEVLCKVLAHNLCVLVQSFYEFGIEPEFWQNGRSALTESRALAMPKLPPRTPWGASNFYHRPT